MSTQSQLPPTKPPRARKPPKRPKPGKEEIPRQGNGVEYLNKYSLLLLLIIILFIIVIILSIILFSKQDDDNVDFSICTLSAETEPMELNMRGILHLFPKSIIIGLNQTQLDSPYGREVKMTVSKFPAAEVDGGKSNYSVQMFGGWYWASSDGTEHLAVSKNTNRIFLPAKNEARFLKSSSYSCRMILIPAIWGNIRNHVYQGGQRIIIVNFTQPWRGYTNSYKQQEGGIGILAGLLYIKKNFSSSKLIMVGDTNINGGWVAQAFERIFPKQYIVNLKGGVPTVNDNEGIANIDLIAIPKTLAPHGVEFGIRYLFDGQSAQHYVAYANIRKRGMFKIIYRDAITQNIEDRMHYLQKNGDSDWNEMCTPEYQGNITANMYNNAQNITWNNITNTVNRESLIKRIERIEASLNL